MDERVSLLEVVDMLDAIDQSLDIIEYTVTRSGEVLSEARAEVCELRSLLAGEVEEEEEFGDSQEEEE